MVPQHWPKFLPNVHCPWQGWPGQPAPQTATAAPGDLTAASTCIPPGGLCGHPPNPDSVNPGCLWLSLTPAAQGAEICLTPEPQWDMSTTPKPTPRAVSELHTGVQTHFSLRHQRHSNSHTVFHGPSEKHRDIPTLPLMEKTEIMLESCMNKIFCFFPTHKHQA